MAAQVVRREDGTFVIEGCDDPMLRGPHESHRAAILALAPVVADRWAEIDGHMRAFIAECDRSIYRATPAQTATP
jgi:hypothetical protein